MGRLSRLVPGPLRLGRGQLLGWGAAALVFIVVLNLSALAKGGFPSKVVGGASVAAGAQPSTQWWFAAGRSEGGVVMDLHLFNPKDEEAAVVLRYFPGGGLTSERRVVVPGRTSYSVSTSADRAGGFGGGYPGLSVAVSADREIVAERTLAWNVPGEHRTGVSTVPGAALLVARALFPRVSTVDGDRAWVSLLNPNDISAEVWLSWGSGSRTVILGPRDRADVELPPGLSSASLRLEASVALAVERVQQQVGDVDGVDVSGPATVLAAPLVPRPFAGPTFVTTIGPCAGDGGRSVTVLVPGPGATVVPAQCPVAAEIRAESTETEHRDVVVQPAVGAEMQWRFALWGGDGEHHDLVLLNPGPRPQSAVVKLVPRALLGERPGPLPPLYLRVSLLPGESKAVTVTDAPSAVEVLGEEPLGAWRVERARKAFQRSYTDPGFR